jgi:pyrroloquinoline-quinone synthase
VNFVRQRSLLEAVASSLTELFAPKIIAERVEGMLANYDFVDREALAYFAPRLTEAPQDSAFALAWCTEHARTPEDQQAVIRALQFKCGVLWSMLDALYFAYVEPGLPIPGAFAPTP